MGNRRLIGAEMEGCQVRDWIIFTNFKYHMCEWRLLKCLKLSGNQRNVTMTACGKSIGGIYPSIAT